MERVKWLAWVCGLLAVLSVAQAAHAAEITRDEYGASAEPICKKNVLANRQIFKGAKGEVKAGKLKLAAGHFFRAARAFNRTISELEALPRPSADEVRLGQWVATLRKEKHLVESIGRALAGDDKKKAEVLSVELNRNSTKANNTVLGFGLDYCRIEPSRFG